MLLTLGYSPCPNDTFIFDALVNKKIDTGGLDFEVVLEDVQTLNEWARQGKLDITKISYGVLPLILEQYQVLNAGGALGKGVGPLLIARSAIAINEHTTVAIPGENTTAHMLFSLAYPYVKQKQFKIFSAIEEAVLKGEVDAGVIIHENRFTYADKGLHKITDLGDYWEKNTGNPIPLGGIVMKRSFEPALMRRIDKLIAASVQDSFKKYPVISNYVQQYAQEMSDTVMRQHIDLYVNGYSLQLGESGRAAVNKFLEVHHEVTKVPFYSGQIFID